jgi:hypothetical protein
MIDFIPTVKTCYGLLLDRDDKTAQNGYYNVYVYNAPGGIIDSTMARLAYAPGTKNNFKTGDHVCILMNFIWNTATQKFELNSNATNVILGKYDPPNNMPVDDVNPNRDIAVPHALYINEKSQAGFMAEDTGSLRIFTNGYVKQEMTRDGNGTYENMHRSFAQNFHRVIANMDPFYYAREFFGYYIGSDAVEKTTNISSQNTRVAFKRFVLQNADKTDRWVSTNEGSFCPWLGNNNETETVTKTKEILYSKVINYEQNRISIFGGEPGDGFFTFRIDKIAKAPLSGEKLNDDGSLTPPTSDCAFYLGINEQGEVLLEAGIDTNKGEPAMQLKITKDGSVDWQVGSKFTINGKKIVTEDFIKFMSKHQADLVQVTAIGAPAPMSPYATPDFKTGSQPDGFLSDIDKNPISSAESPVLAST